MKKTSIFDVGGAEYQVNDLQAMGTLSALLNGNFDNTLWEKGGLTTNGVNDSYRAGCRIRFKYFLKLDSGMVLTSLDTTDVEIMTFTDNGDGTITQSTWLTTATINPNTTVRIEIDGKASSQTEVSMTIDEILAKISIVPAKEFFGSYGRSITNGQLSAMGVSAVYELPKNRAYGLTGIEKTSLDGMPVEAADPYYGCLMCFEANKGGWGSYIFVDNTGKIYYGTSVESTMRWGSRGFEGYYRNVTNGQLGVMGVSAVYQFPRNKAYSLTGIDKTSLAGMPPDASAPYYGCLICFETNSNGWNSYVFIDNTGEMYCGTNSGTEMRWQYKYMDINQQLSVLYGKKVVLVGDSIMYGSHMSDYAQGSRTVITIRGTTVKNNTSTIVWSYLFSQYLTSQYNCTVLNQSFPGCSYNDVTNNLSTLIPDDNDYAILLLGVNDWGNPASIVTHIQTVTAYCKSNNIIPIFVTPYPGKDYVASLAQIRGYLKGYNREVADFYSEFNNMLYVMNVDINTLFDDTIHYNDAAQPYIFEAVKKCLKI